MSGIEVVTDGDGNVWASIPGSDRWRCRTEDDADMTRAEIEAAYGIPADNPGQAR